MAQFTTRRRVEFSETDMAGIVHFANFYRWMEEAEHDFFRSLGLSIMVRQEDGSYIGWPRVSASCNFQAPATYGDEIDVHVNVERIGVKSLTLVIDFFKNGQQIAYGRMKTACCLCFPDGRLESIEIGSPYRDVLTESTDLERRK
ncbi:thioesterase family protein [Maioricimonas sp. JC845]|uniref:acyl-CoA thioesterase n=1 Tax=Maioricimonas sp. JC845 TaxID=3232138 RepID=UPI003458070F